MRIINNYFHCLQMKMGFFLGKKEKAKIIEEYRENFSEVYGFQHIFDDNVSLLIADFTCHTSPCPTYP